MAILAVSEGRDSMEIDEFEVNLILAHRREKEVRKARIIEHIQGGLSDVIGNKHVQWDNWPGSDPMARTIYQRLVVHGFLKE